MIHIFDRNYYRYYGRILAKNDMVYLGYTNSTVEFYIKGNENGKTYITAEIGSDVVNQVDWTRLKIYIDDRLASAEPVVLDELVKTYPIAALDDDKEHKISIVKITEAQMSYAELRNIHVENGILLPLPSQTDNRMKAEFIGDSITCGYGVLGEPHSEFHIREEDGELSYAALTAKELNLNARYTSVSGYGIYCDYTKNVEGTLPKIYPYTNYWVDKEELYDFQDFTPELVVINLGTNDANFLDEPAVQEHFVTSYIDFIKFIRSKYENAKILCICGTLRTEAFPYVEKACQYLIRQGFKDIYCMEQPLHDVEKDGQASEHPSLKTHQKDARQLVAKIRQLFPSLNA